MTTFFRRGITRFVVLGILPLVIILASLGCSDDEAGISKKSEKDPFAGMTLNVAVPAGLGFSQSWQFILEEWSAQTGAKVQLHEYDAADHEVSLPQLIASSVGTETMPALFVAPFPRIAELAVDQLAARVPADQQAPENLNWDDLFLGLRGSRGVMGRKAFFVPISSPVLTCYFRRDLLEQAGLEPPRTWNEYQILLNTLDQWAPGLTAVEPWGAEYRATLFLARSAAFAKHPANISFCFSISTGEPLIDNPGFVSALETARTALSRMPTDVLGYTPADCRRELLSGRAAIGIAQETGPDNSPLPFGPEWKGESNSVNISDALSTGPLGESNDSVELACIRLPGHNKVYNVSLNEWQTPRDGVNYSALTGFGGLAIGVSAANSAQESVAAWNLLGTLTLGNLEAAFLGPTKSVCRSSQIPSGPVWLSHEIGPGAAHSYVNAVAMSLQDSGLALELPLVGRHRFREALTKQLGPYLEAKQPAPTAQKTLTLVADRWREIAQELDPQRIHASHLRTLGLSLAGESK